MSADVQVRLRVSGLAVRDGAFLAVEHAKDGRHYYLLPGGGVDAGERLTDGLVREFAEELGVRVKPGALLMACDSIAPGKARHIVHLVFAVEVEGEPRVTRDDERVVGCAWLTSDALASVDFYPDIAAWIGQALARPVQGAAVLAPEWK